MGESLSVHCKLKITRSGDSYGLQKEGFTSSADFFWPKGEASFFTVGSDKNDTIQIRNLIAKHVSCFLMDNEFTVVANGPAQVITADGKQHDAANGHQVRFSIQENPGVWRINFPQQAATVAGKIYEERVILSPERIACLETKYGVIRKIQDGQSCAIFETSDRHKVVKVLSPTYAADLGMAARFINAARKFTTLPQQLFLPIYEIGYQRQNALCYIATDHFAGESLENYVGKKGILPLAEAIQIAKAVAERLQVFQTLGYAYRNLTLDNVLYNTETQDLRTTGLFLLKSDTEGTLPQTQMVVLNFAAPEQIENAALADVASDMFSLGSILYAMLLGEPPFKCANVREYINAVLKTKTQPLQADDIQKIAPELPSSICETLSSLLAYDKKRRPDPTAFIQSLRPKPSAALLPASGELLGVEALDKLDQLDGLDVAAPKAEALATDALGRLDQLDSLEPPTQVPAASGATASQEPGLSTALQDLLSQTPVAGDAAAIPDPGFSTTFQQLLNRVDKEVKVEEEGGGGHISELLKDETAELTVNDIGKLEVLNITTRISREAVHEEKGPATKKISVDYSSVLGQAAMSADQPQGASPATKKRTKAMTASSSNKKSKQQPPSVSAWTVLFGAATVILLLVLLWPRAPKAPENPNVVANPNVNPHTISAPNNPTKPPEQRIAVSGKIIRVFRYQNNIDYFVVVDEGFNNAEHAVRCPTACPVSLIVNAEKAKSSIEIEGVQETLATGVMMLTKGKSTTQCINPDKIKVGNEIFIKK